ncbi:acyl-homoserine-lactone synthase [Burkholderia sp. LMG 21824]|uniref:acyl-homoserine-lactone synthase n=1 Tax=Burkholderia sp. LMG 21824 TaxID=3158172 RepID=UPI003C2B6778
MQIITGTTTTLGERMTAKMFEYRYKVFVEVLGWDLACERGVEKDQFDREDTVYVLALDDQGELVGIARLLDTSRPYLLGDVFPQLLNGMPKPCDPGIWELSRFAVMDFGAERRGALTQMSSAEAIELIRASICCAARLGARALVTVSPLGVERLLRRSGTHAHRLGPPMVVNDYALFACWIDCEEARASEAELANRIEVNLRRGVTPSGMHAALA